jgi:hypothetical protein
VTSLATYVRISSGSRGAGAAHGHWPVHPGMGIANLLRVPVRQAVDEHLQRAVVGLVTAAFVYLGFLVLTFLHRGDRVRPS